MATRKKSSAKRQTKKERMAQIERQQAFKKEIFLWIVVAVSILLFISNFGIGGHLGNAVSGFLFGVFGMVAYIFPLVLLVGSFFAVSNKGNSYAIMKLVMTIVLIWFICVFMYLAVYGEFAVSPVQSYIDSVKAFRWWLYRCSYRLHFSSGCRNYRCIRGDNCCDDYLSCAHYR